MAESDESCPLLMHYFPGLYHLETIPAHLPWGELCVTALDSRRIIPLVRYRTGDEVRLFSPLEVKKIFIEAGLSESMNRFRGLPVVAVRGRAPRLTLSSGERISVNEIKETMFRDHEIARCVSGNFRLEQAGPGQETRLLIQLSEWYGKPGHMGKRVREKLREFLPRAISVSCFPFRDFPYGFGHDFERKNRYTDVRERR
jgi:phenylacetate-coenzyme A ligase PaaK-like adenylate-forming protein